ncbi:MAG: late competence development ComFB family protein [Lawsonibacter sp.]|jgi:hypothetical protein
MAGRKNARSSKTEHVLNLLSHPTDPQPDVSAAAGQTPPPPQPASPSQPPSSGDAAASRRPLSPILEVARTNNEALEATIQSALEQALADELDTASSQQQPQPPASPLPEADVPSPPPTADSFSPDPETSSPSSAHSDESDSDACLEPAEPQDVAQPSDSFAPPSPQPDSSAEVPDLPPDHAQFINVMQVLVKEKLERYVKLFQLCNCPRCLADAEALALSRLPAKYVVLPKATCSPMLNFYRAKYDSEVSAQVVFACKQVLEFPRH